MLLKWNPERIKVIPLVKMPDNKEQEKIILTREQFSLLPGVNEIPDKEWEIARHHVKDEIKRGDLEILAKDVPAGQGKSKTAKNLVEMPVNSAKNLVKNTVNPETLQKWEQEETREEIRVLIQKQMEKVKTSPVDAEDEDDAE